MDIYSLKRSSYLRCVNCFQLVNRGSDIDELSKVLYFCDVGWNERYVEIPNKELKREVVNMIQVPEYDLFGTIKFNTQELLSQLKKAALWKCVKFFNGFL